MMLTNFDYFLHEMQLELDYFESQLKEYESDPESFSEWLIYETRGKVLALRKILERAETITNQSTVNSLVDDILANPLTTAAIEEVAASEPDLQTYSRDYSPQSLVEAPSVGLVAKVERYERLPLGWIAWLSVRLPGKTCSSRGSRFWLPVGELFGEFRPLSVSKIERLYSLGSTKTRAELKQLFGVSPPASPSLFHTIIEMPDGSKWQAFAHGKGHRWQCVWCNGDGYQDLFPSAA